jgi:hypothetical protein
MAALMAAANGSLADLPLPPVPPDCDLRDLPAIMLHRTLFDSDLAIHSTGDEFKAAITLYDATYGQVPAGSLPADDRSLAFLSRAGAKWPKVKAMAMRGWYQCRDGRFYHVITAEKVLIAWIGRLQQRNKSKAGAAGKHGQTHDQRPILAQISVAYDCLERVNPESRELAKWKRQHPASGNASGNATGDASGGATGRAEAMPQRCQVEGEGEASGKGPSQEKGSKVVELGTARGAVAAA